MNDSLSNHKKPLQKKIASSIHRITKAFYRSATASKVIFFLPFALLLLLIQIREYHHNLRHEVRQLSLMSPSFVVPTTAPYPLFDSTLPEISAQAAVVMDDDSKVFLYEKNADIPLSMASTTKIMTALVALEHFKPDDIITVKTTAIPEVKVGFPVGEKILFKDMLYAMMLASGNDAAMAIAQNYPGGKDAFVQEMNKKAQSYHLYNTHFSDPTGLDDSDYTSAKDLAHLTSLALKNEQLARVVRTKATLIKNITGSHVYKVTNINKLLGLDGVTGVKTGFTDVAGEVLVTSKEDNGHKTIFVVMNSEDRFADTKRFLETVKDQILYTNFIQ